MLPFPGGIEATANATLIFSIGAAILYTFVLERPQSLLRSATKTLSVASLGVLLILLRRVPGSLRIPVIAYSMAILFMGLASLTAPHVLIVAGAALFMASDTLLGWERFVMTSLSRNRLAVRYAVWVLYYLAQLVITMAYVVVK